MGRIIGIDLGTTTCEVAYLNNGQPEIILNDLHKKITPSVVSISDEDGFIVGELAKRQAILKPDETVIEVKRLMGESNKIKLGDKELLPEEISAIILKKLKEDAEKYLGEEVTEAVITVPANFNDFQRKATKKAGEIAGLKIERIINEPTAAALAYGINNLNNNEKILVYDLGGGTFDVTVLELFEGVIDVKSSRGNNKLGGKDFNEIIESYIINNFEAHYEVSLKNNIKAVARIKEVAEKAKIKLSEEEEVDINIPFIEVDKEGNPLEININLTRSKFELFIMDLVDSTEGIIDDAIKAAGYTVNDIDVVISVGGSSRIPCIQRLLQEKFNNKIRYNVNPDEAVALGAAIQAAIKNDDISPENGILITDACSHTLGTSIVEKIADGKFMDCIYDPIIPRDTKIPCTEKKTYHTIKDNQTSVIIDVYQGEQKLATKNIKIGEFILKGIPKAPAGKEAIEVSFTYDLNGMLQVFAKILSTGKTIKKVINTSKEDSKKLKKDNKEKNNKKDLKIWEEAELYNNFKSIVIFAEKKINKINDDESRKKVRMAIDKLKKSVICEEKEKAEKYNEELTDLLFELD
ncbi:molecular chaperone DnaK [Clostridium botulinum]|uniref:Chaperone protein DnaK n=1 Tax=Clostridium botulinum C/D str. DC5 TaxID=1443128 RepID=A0A0A0IIB2_CLOBO|nr:Hsp70 family protein [Clostridium botulinum]MCD3233427.1 Hsp70 family protein [Clostridium botulinum D/C]KGN00693.1 molecular chaperone DnaK [Clostridium botulinum C/D str. DC5]KOC53085.1 molecular chaperone DnaK [Clostridium botulinum]KOC58525.1 molecular chaperone DnaK [Clostridium botulinum]MCD3239176.1 Hsp70 family protein [Clostridium botulinum D/C]